MKNKVIYLLVVILILVFTCGLLLFLNFNNSLKFENITSEREKLDLKITQLEVLVESLNNQLNHSKPDDLEQTSRKCTFTRTLKYIDIIDYEGQVKETFALFSEFQGSTPIILRFEPDFKISFEKAKNYEITFTGNVGNEDNLLTYQIISYRQTNKSGLDQIQESCKNE